MTQQEAIRVLDLARDGQTLPSPLIQLALSVTDQQPRPDDAEQYEQFLQLLREAGLL